MEEVEDTADNSRKLAMLGGDYGGVKPFFAMFRSQPIAAPQEIAPAAMVSRRRRCNHPERW
jgi:hypothetical protein